MCFIERMIKKVFSKLFCVACVLLITHHVALASETSGTIVSGTDEGFAWSDQAGWVNFGCANCDIAITDSGIIGHAWNDMYGWINLDPTNGGVSVAADGALSGHAWGESLGWIDFSGVSISQTGVFSGEATGDRIGTLNFNCANCSVMTDYVPSSYRSSAGNNLTGSRISTAATPDEDHVPDAVVDDELQLPERTTESVPSQSAAVRDAAAGEAYEESREQVDVVPREDVETPADAVATDARPSSLPLAIFGIVLILFLFLILWYRRRRAE